MRFKKWNIGTPAERDVALLRSAGYPYLLSTVLAARGVTTAEAAAEALERDRSLSMSPMLMRDMDKAVARIQRAISQGETIAVFGDYDVDGITSTVLLMDYLKSCGVRCLRHIPRRIEEGYGLSKEAIQGLRDQGATLMITVDCGITGNEEVDFAASIGLDVVITDHHECKEELPRALAVVDPHRSDCPYPFKHLAGVGVALKLVLALGGESREDALFARYCTLAAIGTIADVMRMEGENRTIAFCGLEALPHTDFVGVHALLKEAGLLGKPITSVQIGFVLAPRINAAGRMGAADLAADLLETDDPARAEELAKALCDLNRERQAVEQAICADATEKIERLRAEDRSALVLSSEDWHQGVVGIVASRLSEKYACPSFMIHLKDGVGKGSCRSYGGFNLFSALESCADLLEGFGGHELAAGFTISEENIDAFRARMNRYVRSASGGERAVSCLDVDAPISCPGEVTLAEVEHEGDRIKVYVVEVRNSTRGPQVLISRTHPGLVKRLFELEVPEIFDGTVEIKSIAREAGSRTKMAVWAEDPVIDPIGACVGPKGGRVASVVNELGGEKIDIVKYSEVPEEFIAAALAPSEVLEVTLLDEGKSCRVIVPDNQLSLAIGKEGQNARLAAKLTGYKIDIKPESEA